MNKVDEIARVDAQAFLLEALLRLLKEHLNSETDKLSEEERAEYRDKVMAWLQQDSLSEKTAKSVRAIWDAVRSIPIPGDETWIFRRFDKSGEMIVQIHMSGKVLEVEVLTSIEAWPSNFEHPVIQWAIGRAAAHSLDDSHPANKFLDRLPDALRKGSADPGGLRPYRRLAELRPADPTYCAVLWSALRDLGIYDYDPGEVRRLRPDAIEGLKEKLDELLPGQDHEKAIEFLCAGLLPMDNRFPALVSAFNKFLYNKRIQAGSHSTLVSRAKKQIKDVGDPLSFVSEQSNIEGVSEDLVMNWLFGSRVIATPEQVTKSGLCFREVSGEEMFTGAQMTDAELPDDQE